ncbi:MAG: hypothetical protein E2O76_15230 [Caldithrix sp.]|nr:MAG: hypothetical protein E2O76_15230 [Caldithrix sp.]
MIPPLPCLLGFVLGLACDWGWPWPLGPYEYVLPAGVLLAVVVVAAMVTLLRAFSRHDTSPGPERRDHRHRRHWGPSGSRAIRPMSPRGFSRRSWGCSSTMSGFCSQIHAGNDRHPLCRRATARSLLGRKVRRGVP